MGRCVMAEVNSATSSPEGLLPALPRLPLLPLPVPHSKGRGSRLGAIWACLLGCLGGGARTVFFRIARCDERSTRGNGFFLFHFSTLSELLRELGVLFRRSPLEGRGSVNTRVNPRQSRPFYRHSWKERVSAVFLSRCHRPLSRLQKWSRLSDAAPPPKMLLRLGLR